MRKNRVLAILLLMAMGMMMPWSALAMEELEYDGYLFGLADHADRPDDVPEITHVGGGTYRAESAEDILDYVPEKDILYIEPDWIITVDPIKETAADNLEALSTYSWAYSAINGSASLSAGLTGEGVTVAIIDSGLAPDHPDINHGTPVTGIIAAQINDIGIDGLAPDVTLVPLKVFQATQGSSANTIKAIYDAIDVYGADVINMSFGYEGVRISNSYAKAIEYAADNGAILVAAAGNDRNAGTYYPANCEQVVGVGSLSYAMGRMSASDNSARSEAVFVTAPGNRVLSLSQKGDTVTKSGTSFSTPHVTAMAALAKSVYPDMTYVEFQQLLIDSVDDAGTPGYNTTYGHGTINLQTFTDLLIGENWFYDVSGHWAEAEILNLTGRGIMTGLTEHDFGVEVTMTRGMFVETIGRYHELEVAPIADLSSPFTDVPDGSQYANYAAWAAEIGVVEGHGDGTYAPDDEITREQMATLLRRYADYVELPASDDLTLVSAFEDGDTVSDWAVEAVSWAVETGLIQGQPAGNLEPAGDATRAQCATIVVRYIDMLEACTG